MITLIYGIMMKSNLWGQELLGNTGGMNIPTAEMLPAGTFRCGINYIGNGVITPEKGNNDYRWNFNYNTFNYFLNFTFFDWFEATFRETILKSNNYGKYDDYKLFREQDRSITLKVRLVKEGKYWPAVALGVNDPYSFTGHHIYASAWGVITKNIHSRRLASKMTATVGYMKGFDKSQMYDGCIAALRITPDFLPQTSAIIEYDSKGVNVGIQATIYKYVGIYCFTREFKSISAGIKYQTTLHF